MVVQYSRSDNKWKGGCASLYYTRLLLKRSTTTVDSPGRRITRSAVSRLNQRSVSPLPWLMHSSHSLDRPVMSWETGLISRQTSGLLYSTSQTYTGLFHSSKKGDIKKSVYCTQQCDLLDSEKILLQLLQ